MTVDDAEAVFELNRDPEVMAYTGEARWESLEQTRERIATYPDFQTHGFGRWGLVHRADGRLIGMSGFKYQDDLGEIDLGYRLLPAYWGRGLATESARACVRFGFEHMGLQAVIGLVLPANTASHGVLRKAGFADAGMIDLGDVWARRYVLDRATWRRAR